MRGKFVTGALIGAAISFLVAPELDRTTKRRIRKTSKFMRGAAEDIYDNAVKKWIR